MNPNDIATHPMEMACSVLTVSRKSVQIPIRFEPEDIELAESIREALADTDQFRALRMSRAAVMRWAMLEGFEVIRERHQLPRASTTKKKPSRPR